MQNVIVKKQTTYNLKETEKNIEDIFLQLNIPERLKNIKKILLKPNLLGAHHPDKAVTTHPIIVEAIIILLKQLHKEVFLGDSPGGNVKIGSVWEATGMKQICDKHKIQLVDFGKDGIINYKGNSANLYFDKQVTECEGIINIAKMKTHSLMLYTGAVKNLYGTIPGLYKSELHKDFPNPKDFSNVLLDIYEYMKPKIILNIIDGIIGMEGEGPAAGRPYPFGVIIASEKATAADYVGTGIMGFNFNDITYLKQCLENDKIDEKEIFINLTQSSVEEIEEYKHNNVKINTVIFINKILDKMPKFIKNLLGIYFYKYPSFNKNCKMCLICKASCPVKAIEIKNNKLFLDKKKCIKCLCCQEMCPYFAIKM